MHKTFESQKRIMLHFRLFEPVTPALILECRKCLKLCKNTKL